MAKPKFLAVLGVLCFCACLFAQAQAEEEKSADKKEKFFVASYMTTTYTSLSIVSTTQPYFCVLSVNGIKACAGRSLRRRRKIDPVGGDISKLRKLEQIDSSVPLNIELNDSMQEDPGKMSEEPATDEKFLFTVWKTSTTFTTITSTSKNRGVTHSASAYCTFTNFDAPLC